MTPEEIVERAAEVLAEHWWVSPQCSCGVVVPGEWMNERAYVWHAKHQAQALADAGLLKGHRGAADEHLAKTYLRLAAIERDSGQEVAAQAYETAADAVGATCPHCAGTLLGAELERRVAADTGERHDLDDVIADLGINVPPSRAEQQKELAERFANAERDRDALVDQIAASLGADVPGPPVDGREVDRAPEDVLTVKAVEDLRDAIVEQRGMARQSFAPCREEKAAWFPQTGDGAPSVPPAAVSPVAGGPPQEPQGSGGESAPSPPPPDDGLLEQYGIDFRPKHIDQIRAEQRAKKES